MRYTAKNQRSFVNTGCIFVFFCPPAAALVVSQLPQMVENLEARILREKNKDHRNSEAANQRIHFKVVLLIYKSRKGRGPHHLRRVPAVFTQEMSQIDRKSTDHTCSMNQIQWS